MIGAVNWGKNWRRHRSIVVNMPAQQLEQMSLAGNFNQISIVLVARWPRGKPNMRRLGRSKSGKIGGSSDSMRSLSWQRGSSLYLKRLVGKLDAQLGSSTEEVICLSPQLAVATKVHDRVWGVEFKLGQKNLKDFLLAHHKTNLWSLNLKTIPPCDIAVQFVNTLGHVIRRCF